MIKEFKDLKLLNFNDLLQKIEIGILNDLENFGLIHDFSVNLKNPDVKKLIYHNLLFGICEEIKTISKDKINALIVPPEISSDHEISNFCDIDKFYELTLKFVRRIKNHLPFVIYMSQNSITSILEDEGRKSDMVAMIYDLYDKKQNKKYSLENIKQLSKKLDLIYLNQNYFNSVEIRSNINK